MASFSEKNDAKRLESANDGCHQFFSPYNHGWIKKQLN